MTVAVVCLALIVFALIAALKYMHDRHVAERHELLDRLQFPDVTKTALAVSTMPEPRKPEPEVPVYQKTTDPDLLYLQELA